MSIAMARQLPMLLLLQIFDLASGAYSTLSTYAPGAFVIRRQIGQLGFATEIEWQYNRDGTPVKPNPLDPLQPKRTIEASGISVRLFDARLDDGTRVLLKEFIGDACSIGENECATHEVLYQRALAAASGTMLPAQPPPQIGRLLGLMRADSTFASESFVADWEMALPNIAPPSPTGLWLVFAWENLMTVSNFPQQPQERAMFDFDGRAAARERSAFVKTVALRCLETVDWLHGQGIAHRSLGGSSLLLNTYDQRTLPGSVGIKAIDLGFAATAARISPEEVAAAIKRGASGPLDVIPFLCRADDLHALAYVLLELLLQTATPASPPPPAGLASFLSKSDVFSAASADEVGGGVRQAAEDRPPPPSDLQSLKRLVEDVFKGDVCGEFRQYCAEEPAWASAVAILDESDRAGWRVIQELVECRDASSAAAENVSARRLLESAWFA